MPIIFVKILNRVVSIFNPPGIIGDGFRESKGKNPLFAGPFPSDEVALRWGEERLQRLLAEQAVERLTAENAELKQRLSVFEAKETEASEKRGRDERSRQEALRKAAEKKTEQERQRQADILAEQERDYQAWMAGGPQPRWWAGKQEGLYAPDGPDDD